MAEESQVNVGSGHLRACADKLEGALRIYSRGIEQYGDFATRAIDDLKKGEWRPLKLMRAWNDLMRDWMSNGLDLVSLVVSHEVEAKRSASRKKPAGAARSARSSKGKGRPSRGAGGRR